MLTNYNINSRCCGRLKISRTTKKTYSLPVRAKKLNPLRVQKQGGHLTITFDKEIEKYKGTSLHISNANTAFKETLKKVRRKKTNLTQQETWKEVFL